MNKFTFAFLAITCLVVANSKSSSQYNGQSSDQYNGQKLNIYLPIMGSMMQDMDWVKVGYGDIDLDFCAMMTPHHWGAIFMCEEHLKHGKSEEIKGICREIVTGQIKQVIKFKNYLNKKGINYDDPSLTPHFPLIDVNYYNN